MFERIRQFLQRDLWAADLRHRRGFRGVLLAALRVSVHALRSFLDDLGSLRASGLTLVTLLAVVPLLALVTGVAKGLGYGERLDEDLRGLMAQLPESMQPAVDQVRQLVERTSFGALGVIGSLVLAWSALQLFVQVEQAFNRTWHTPRGRSWYRRISDFLALLVLVPVLLISAMSLQSLLEGAEWFRNVAWLDALYHAGLGVVPHVLAWVAFTALYRILPAARVRWGPASVAGITAGSSWLFVHAAYVSMQLGVARSNAIYATMAALPLLIAYLQVTWTIILVGAEISYAVQMREELRGTQQVAPAGPALRTRLALLVAWESTRRFLEGGRGVDLRQLAHDLDLPMEWLSRSFEDLRRAGLFGMVSDSEQVVPLRSPRRIALLDVLDAVRGDVPSDIRLELPEELDHRLREAESAARAAFAGADFGDSVQERDWRSGGRSSMG